MTLEQIATSNNEEYEAPKNEKLTKKEVSDKVDYNLDKVDEKKFKKFKKMADYIKENGKEFWDEYRNIVNNAITPFEEKISKILNKEKFLKKNNIDVSSASDEQLQEEADKRAGLQPEELNWQREILKEIINNWSEQEIQQLNEIVNNNMADVQSFYDKIAGWNWLSGIQWWGRFWNENNNVHFSWDFIHSDLDWKSASIWISSRLWNEWSEWWNTTEPQAWWDWLSGAQWWGREW